MLAARRYLQPQDTQPEPNLVVGGVVPQVAVQDSHKAVRHPAKDVIVADIAGRRLS